jgi:hypothetical protein
MPSVPQPGDVILRYSSDSEFVVVAAGSESIVGGPVSLPIAVALARRHCTGTIWHQEIDEAGRPVNAPVAMGV